MLIFSMPWLFEENYRLVLALNMDSRFLIIVADQYYIINIAISKKNTKDL